MKALQRLERLEVAARDSEMLVWVASHVPEERTALASWLVALADKGYIVEPGRAVRDLAATHEPPLCEPDPILSGLSDDELMLIILWDALSHIPAKWHAPDALPVALALARDVFHCPDATDDEVSALVCARGQQLQEAMNATRGHERYERP